MQLVRLDFETASSINLRLVGAEAYAEHPTTEILCLCWRVGSYKFRWFPGNPIDALKWFATDPEALFVAHNAAFEQAIWRHKMVPEFGLPPLPPERWDCTLAACAWKAIPLKLEVAGRVLGVPVEKDMEGNRLTLGLSRLNKKTGMYPERTPAVLSRVADYCDRDIVVEDGVMDRVGLISQQSPQERGIWLLDQKINQRGVRIDLDFVRQAQLVIDRAKVPLMAEFRDLTGGLNPGQRDKLMEWAGGQGVELPNLQKATIAALLNTEEDDSDPTAGYGSLCEELPDDAGRQNLPDKVARVLSIRSMLGSVSITKLARMRACVGSDGRARGLFQYHAASTGRWGGRLLQPQNFPRGTVKVDPEHAVEAIMTGDPEYVEMVLGAPAIECVASSLRHALIPDPGHIFLVGDFAGIEARVVLALAGQHDKAALMASGQDVYLDMACDIYGLPKGSLTKADIEKRQVGKNSVLGCGFQMGPAKFHARYCSDQPIEFAERVVEAYRKQWAPKVPELWYGLERAALLAMRTGHKAESHGVVYEHIGDWLVAYLPNGWQRVWYPFPRLFYDETFGKAAWKYTAYKMGKLVNVKAYGGLEAENIVQALARGLLVASMMRLERYMMPIIMTSHDECVCEVPEGQADVKAFEQLMAEPTPWARRLGIPIAVEAWCGDRYRK